MKLNLIALALFFTQSLFAQTPVNWQAKWIEAPDQKAFGQSQAQYFRTTFKADKKVKSATLYITAHGIYEAQINGKKVGEDFLTPGWTSYNKRLQYQQYDVTKMLQQKENVLGVMVGNGWYRGNLVWNSDRNFFGDKLGVLAQLEITLSNGQKQIINSNQDWKVGSDAITFSEIYHGETIDNRLAENWSGVKFDDSKWTAVKEADYGYQNLVLQQNEPVRKHETFPALKLITTPKGEKVIDFGQNLTGWVMVKAKGKAGDSIQIWHGEVLTKEGNFYRDNLRNAKAKATYILKGEGDEFFEPHFTFYGFRYIKIEAKGDIDPKDFTAVAVYSDMKPTGTFECSSPLVNQLQHNIQWGQRGNFVDVPTDCPQRDERLGWTGDAQAFYRTGSFNFDVKDFFTKWMRDVSADQTAEGSVPHVVPDVLGMRAPHEKGSSGWADVATIVPWGLYEVYGDKKLLAEEYQSMKKWVDFVTSKTTNNLWQTGNHFGDWLSYRPGDDGGTEAVTDKFQIAQCFYANSLQLVVNASKVLGKQDDVAKYSALLAKAKEAFLREYVTPNGRIMSNTQTAYVLALQFDMLPESMRANAVNYLVDNIKRYGTHLTTGFLGTPYLCHVLSRFGHNDIAYKLLLQESYPSWLYPVKMGATTVWERWDGIKPDGSFQTTVMNSFNHYAYGAIGDWMYRVVAGIDTDKEKVGYQKIMIKPMPAEGLTWAKASYDSPKGMIKSGWKNENGKFILDVEIPKGTTAQINVPNASGKDFKVYEVGAGKHHYER